MAFLDDIPDDAHDIRVEGETPGARRAVFVAKDPVTGQDQPRVVEEAVFANKVGKVMSGLGAGVGAAIGALLALGGEKLVRMAMTTKAISKWKTAGIGALIGGGLGAYGGWSSAAPLTEETFNEISRISAMQDVDRPFVPVRAEEQARLLAEARAESGIKPPSSIDPSEQAAMRELAAIDARLGQMERALEPLDHALTQATAAHSEPLANKPRAPHGGKPHTSHAAAHNKQGHDKQGHRSGTHFQDMLAQQDAHAPTASRNA